MGSLSLWNLSHHSVLLESVFRCTSHPLSHLDISWPAQCRLQESLGNKKRKGKWSGQVDEAVASLLVAVQNPDHPHELTRLSDSYVRLQPAWHTWCHPEYGGWGGLMEGGKNRVTWCTRDIVKCLRALRFLDFLGPK